MPGKWVGRAATSDERIDADREGTGDGAAPFRAHGHSKDHRADLPQVVIRLAVTREGIPVRVRVWPGNTNDQSVIEQVKDDLRGWPLGAASGSSIAALAPRRTCGT